MYLGHNVQNTCLRGVSAASLIKQLNQHTPDGSQSHRHLYANQSNSFLCFSRSQSCSTATTTTSRSVPHLATRELYKTCNGAIEVERFISSSLFDDHIKQETTAEGVKSCLQRKYDKHAATCPLTIFHDTEVNLLVIIPMRRSINY